MRFVTAFTFACSALLVSALAAEVSNGERAPGFTLPSATGEQVSLSDFEGKFVVLEWVNPSCPFVKKFYHAGAMQDFQEKAGDMGVVWLTINSTKPGHGDHLSEAQTVAYQKEHGIPSTWLLDEAGDVGRAYGATRTPHMYVIDPEGILVYQGAIDDQNSANARTLDGAHNYVFAALDSAMNGQAVKDAQTRPYGCGIKY